MMRRVALLVALLVATAACGGGDQTSDSPTPPYGLAAGQPDSPDGVLAALAAMPPEVAGQPRSPGEHPFIVQYGDANSIVAIPLADDDPPLAEDLGRFQMEEGAEVEDIQITGSGLVWLIGSFPDGGGAGTVYLAVWGDPDAEWAFNVSAESPQIRDAIARAFAEAAG